MSRNELVDAYLSGAINRRTFVRGLVALGVSASVAASYAVALHPSAAHDVSDELYGRRRRRRRRRKQRKQRKQRR